MRALPRIAIALGVVLALGLGGWYVDARRARLRSTLSGYFETRPTEIASRTAGRITALLVHEGDPVHVGERLAVLDAAPSRLDTRAKQAAAQEAAEKLREVEAGARPEDIRKQEAAVREARASWKRLVDGPLPQEVSQARARVREALEQYRKAAAGPRPQEIEQARAAERVAAARLAQARRGFTPEEKQEAKARYDASVAQETLAASDAQRYRLLFAEDAISRQQMDQSESSYQQAAAHRKEMEEAWTRAEEGTPAEEMEQYRQAHLQAVAALDLLLAGSRPEDIAAARATWRQAYEALKLLLAGSRKEDILAARERLREQQAVLAELMAGNRREDIAQARAAAESAKASAMSSREASSEYIVRSPVDGVVQGVSVASGSLMPAGGLLMRVDSPADIWIRVYVPEAQLARVVVGEPARIRVDGVPGDLPGHVESIASNGEFTPANLQTPNERGKQVFGVRLRLNQPDPRVKSGMYATVVSLGSWQP
ncbi:MAG TPA: efflux RND transporter periplasmic adaptor subunit [Chthonomonadales bacterium]|nr:efflux RND transporter periplasmic adaptor subunit [Chthonomonadales bacterium]